MAARISISHASFSYGEQEIWRDINLEVERGETICLLGPNGCGKTTLLNCIHGDLVLKEGVIFLDGQDIRNMNITDIALKMGYVFQEHTSSFPYDSLEVVRMGRAPHLKIFQSPTEVDTRLAASIMTDMGIGYLAKKRYTRISGGERQLVLIARTLCQGPEIILFDEPTSHLDFKNQALVLETIARLSQMGLTIVFTSHFPNHAWLLKGRVVMMNNKGLVASGLSEEVMTEENLSKTYGVRVKVYRAQDGERTINFCNPELESRNTLRGSATHYDMQEMKMSTKTNTLKQGMTPEMANHMAYMAKSGGHSYIAPLLAKQVLTDYKISQGRCLDVGTGSGLLSIELAKISDLDITALDISPLMVKIANEEVSSNKLEKRIRVIEADAQKIPFDRNYFDLIVSKGTLWFFKDKVQAFKEMYRVLKPGGVIYIGCGDARRVPRNLSGFKKMLAFRLENQRRKFDKHWKELRLPPSKWDEILKQAGIDQFKYYPGYFWIEIRKPKTAKES
jgi:iron complex transport system ATP-binding protein